MQHCCTRWPPIDTGIKQAETIDALTRGSVTLWSSGGTESDVGERSLWYPAFGRSTTIEDL